MKIETRYSICDVVYAPTTTRTGQRITCTACAGIGKLKLDGSPFTCSTCHGYGWFPGPTENRPATRRLTIGQVRVTVGGDDDERVYMARETGIGSGQLWNEDALYATEAEAEGRARELANERNRSDLAKWESQRAKELAMALAETRAAATSSEAIDDPIHRSEM